MLHRWLDQFVAWHYARVSNRPTDAIDSLIKQVKRTSFGFRRLRNYTFRVMLCAGRSY
jgi:transposase